MNGLYEGKLLKPPDQQPIEPDEIETMFQNIKDNVSDIKTKTIRILKCVPDSDLNKGFFKSSIENDKSLDLNNAHNSPSINMDLKYSQCLGGYNKEYGSLSISMPTPRGQSVVCSHCFKKAYTGALGSVFNKKRHRYRPRKGFNGAGAGPKT